MSFGDPRKLGTDTWGATAYLEEDVDTGQIREAMKSWGKGCFDCIDPTNRSMTEYKIAPGVTNNFPEDWTTTQASNHGDQWARMAANINEYFADNGYDGVITARGAIDIELSYDWPVITRHWADAYNEAPARPGYVNFGGAAGCQDFDSGDYTACGSPPFHSWSSSDVHYVSWGVLAAFPLPQIYREDGKQAEQWVMISKWGYDTGNGEMGFKAPLSEDQACAQVNDCGGTRNTPLMAWNQMDAKMDAKPNTKVQMDFSTDIKWQNP